MNRDLLAGSVALPFGFCIAIVVAGAAFSLAPPAVALSLTIVILAVVVGLLHGWAHGLFDDPQIAEDKAAALAALAAQRREIFEQMDAELERLRYVRFEPRYGGQVVGVTHKEELARITRCRRSDLRSWKEERARLQRDGWDI